MTCRAAGETVEPWRIRDDEPKAKALGDHALELGVGGCDVTQSPQRGGVDYRRSQQDATQSCSRKCFGFAEFRATDPHRALCDLLVRDPGALVDLRVRA
jgi:hypothetical protein